ncbi:MAG TPA: hypothetical protein PKM44_06545 [Turneriella sp.]|nr:hypothetical protein [Turneriella sp.]HMY10708.1 hypothetical protein [Turneriella sp.]HNA80030.1 hypothetical protein [Turneriella sp.]HNE18416.1 hypothetical protein [Turneriella sp.]HNJ66128.1 hypothetical protein [Turneriella sp.]
MRYLKSAMPVPGKGTAFMLYEIEGENTIVRMLTHIPETNEIKLYPSPKMKTLFQPERLDEAAKEEFEYIWDMGSEQA